MGKSEAAVIVLMEAAGGMEKPDHLGHGYSAADFLGS